MADCKPKNRNGSGSLWMGQTGMCLWLPRDFLQYPTEFCVAEAELVGGTVLLEEACRWGWAQRGTGFVPLLVWLSRCHVCREGCDLSASCLHPLWPCLPPGIRTQPLEPKVKRNSSFPKLISSVCFLTESEEQLIHPLGLYGTRHETFSESSPRKPSP